MMWQPVHGCTLPLPVRTANQCGVKKQGPKPSPLFRVLQKHAFWLWIYRNGGGPEAVADFLLARLTWGMKPGDADAALAVVRQCQAWMDGTDTRAVRHDPLGTLLRQVEASAKQREKDAEAAWEQRKRLLIERDKRDVLVLICK